VKLRKADRGAPRRGSSSHDPERRNGSDRGNGDRRGAGNRSRNGEARGHRDADDRVRNAQRGPVDRRDDRGRDDRANGHRSPPDHNGERRHDDRRNAEQARGRDDHGRDDHGRDPQARDDHGRAGHGDGGRADQAHARHDRDARLGNGHDDARRGKPGREPARREQGKGGGGHDEGGEGDVHRKPPSKHARLWLYLVGAVAVVAAAAFLWILHHRRTTADEQERRERQDQQARGPEIPVVTAKPAPPTRKLELPGDVHAFREATVYARVSGYLAELAVDRGDRVKRDQILGRVATPENEMQLAPLAASLTTKRAIADRLRPLVPKGVVTQQDLDQADAAVQQAQSDVDRLRALRNFDVIRAPFDGIVTRRYVDVGALMPAPTGSTQSSQPLVDLADTSRVRVVVYVGQRDATGIHVGDALAVVRDGDPLHPIKATVTRVPEDLDVRTRTMWVESDIENTSGALYPGVFVTVTIEVPAAPGVLIPSEAISLVEGKPTVAVVRDGKAKFTVVTVADDDGKLARVIRGLASGDTIATRVSDEIADGGTVRPVQPKAPQAGGGDKKDGDKGKADKQQGAGSGQGSGGSSGKGSGSSAQQDTSPGGGPLGIGSGSGGDS
jgi:multidrug efflux system membrane fusion protein